MFTVETLDGHCGMSEYYRRREGDGSWVGLLAPPAGFKKPPVCPTCRAAITSPRYGRIFKRADLDILERNVASRMAQSLSKIQTSLSRIDKARTEEALKVAVNSITSITAGEKKDALSLEARTKLLSDKVDVPTPFNALNAQGSFHTISQEVARKWSKIVAPIIGAYKQATVAAGTRSAHVNAWSAAYSQLYATELERLMSNPSRLPKRPENNALRVARMSVGQPEPRADKRFVVEAFWLTIEIRYQLAEYAKIWLQESRNAESYTPEEQAAWAAFALFILMTCLHDADAAFRISKESESPKQMTKTKLYTMRTELEFLRLEYEAVQILGSLGDGRREEMANRAAEKASSAKALVEEGRTIYTNFMQGARDNDPWLQENFIVPSLVIFEEWENLIKSLRMSTFYAPVSLEEKMKVVEAFQAEFCECTFAPLFGV